MTSIFFQYPVYVCVKDASTYEHMHACVNINIFLQSFSIIFTLLGMHRYRETINKSRRNSADKNKDDPRIENEKRSYSSLETESKHGKLFKNSSG